MKRKDFFTRTILGFIAIWKAPEILAKEHVGDSPQPYLDRFKEIRRTSNRSQPGIPYKWFEENYSWLQHWVKNYRVQSWHKNGEQLSVSEYYDGMQVFQDFPFQPSTPVEIMENKDGSQTLVHGCKYLNSKLAEHIKEIIRHAVFARKSSFSTNGIRRDTMSGFVEQMGRLPIETDLVRFVISSKDAHGMRYLNARKSKNEYGEEEIKFLSDCRLEIAGIPFKYRPHWTPEEEKELLNVNN